MWALVTITKRSYRDHYCEAKLDKLHEVSDWIEQYRKFWEERFDALEIYLNKLQAKKPKKHGKKK